MTPKYLTKAARLLSEQGLKGVAAASLRIASPPRSPVAASVRPFVRTGKGIEIGGPSQFFGRRGYLPIYPFATTLDNCNFADTTLWEGSISAGNHFVYNKRRSPGIQFIGEASALSALTTGRRYDYMLSSHALEHLANPIAALLDWKSILSPEGRIILVLPHKDGTFDHRRPVTTLEHLVDDHYRQVGEDDQTHIEEVLALHDLSRDPGASSPEAFAARTRDNASNRGLHHHVFDGHLTAKLLDYCGFTISHMECVRPFHILAIASTKNPAGENAPFLSPKAPFLAHSPFRSDQCC